MASKRDLTKYLNDLSKEELFKEVEKLYQKFKEVKNYYDIDLGGDTTELVKQIKAKIKNEYMPARGFGKARSSFVKKLIDDFAKVSIYPSDLIDVILYRVEIATEFGISFGYDSEAFYNSCDSAFERALILIKKNNLEFEFKERCRQLILKTNNHGWFDQLECLYNQYFGN